MWTMVVNPGEEHIAGGNVGTAVVRVGDTVRPLAGGPWSRSVDALLSRLNAVGYEGAPRTLGFDELGRHVLEYIEGTFSCRSSPITIWQEPIGSGF